MSLDGSGSSRGPPTEDQQATPANDVASHSPNLLSTNGVEITLLTSPGPDSSRQEVDMGDMSLPAEQRRHLLELESSFKIDSDLGTTPEEESSTISGRIGDMGPPPLPPAGVPRRGLQRTPSSVSNHRKLRSGAATPTTIAGSREDLRGKKFLADAEETTSSFADYGAFSPLQTPIPTSETDGEPNLSSSPTLAARARNNNRSSTGLAAAFVPSSSHEPSPEEIGLAIDRRPSTVSVKGEGNYGSLGSEEATSAARPTGSVRGRGLSSNSSSNLVGGSASGTHRRRPKFLRSRQSSQRSSVSSIGDTGMEAGDDGATTVEGGGVLSRSASLGSIASGITGIVGAGSIRGTEGLFGAMSTAAERALARLDEEEKNSRRGSVAGGTEESGPKDDAIAEPTTPKFQKTPLPPTDTAITAQVKSVHVPATVAREYRAGHLASMQTPGSPSKRGGPGATPAPGQGKNMTLKEQSTIIDRLQKENFDLKIKVFYLNDKLEKQSDEGVKEMMKENVDMKVKLAEGMRERKSLKRRIKELEKKIQEMGGEKEGKEDGEDNITELWELKERVERYEVEIEELSRREKEREDRMREEISRGGAVGGERAEEVGMLREFLETETARREKVDMENRRLREEIWRMKNESSGQPYLNSHHSISTRHSSTRSVSERDRDESRERGLMNQLRVENDELRREVGAQTSMLTSRNREKDRLYQEIEDLKLHLRNGGGSALGMVAEHDQHQQHQNRAASVISDRILDRSVSRAGGAASVAGTHVSMLSESEREDFENANGQLRDRISELRLKNQELQIQIENCYREIDQKTEDVERVVAEYEEELQLAHAEVQEMQAERNDALRMREEIEMDFDQLKEEAEEEIQKLEEELDIRLGDIAKLGEDVRCKEEDFKGLQQEMRNVSDIVVRLEDVHEGHVGEVRRLEEKIEDLQRTLRENEQEMSVLEGSLREANEKIERMTVQSESAKGEIAFLREEQDADKIKIGELETVIKGLEETIEEEREKVADARERLESERKDREKMGDKRQQEWERKVNEKSQEVMNAKDEVRRLRSKVSNREEEAKQWRERLEELERALREALGDLSGTRTGLFKSIVNLQSELESTLEELDCTKNDLVEKDRVLKDRENLLEGMALESRKLTDLLDKERAGRKSDRAALETLKTTHHHTRHTITQHQTQYTELEKTRNKESKSIHQLEQQYREQLAERNNLLTQIWLRLSALCGPDWTHRNSLVSTNTNNVSGKQSMEAAVVGALPGFQKNMLIAVKTIESIVAGFKTRCRGVERDLWKEYQVVENALESRTRRLERLENLVRGGIGEQNGMRTEVAKLRTENRLLRAELNVVKNEASSATTTTATTAVSSSQQTSPILHRSKTSTAVPQQPPKEKGTSAPTSTVITRTSSAASAPTDPQDVSEKRWILRLRELEKRLKAEREARLLDRSAAKKKVEEARGASAEYKAELERERAVSGSKK